MALTLLGCAMILIARRPDLLHSPQFWAEDGTVFFLQSQTEGARALFASYAGYLHTALRLVAGLVGLVDVTLAPALYCTAALLLTLYVAARTQSGRFPLPASPAYALAVVLVPDAFEVLLNLTNLQWILATGLILVLIAREPTRASQRVHDALAVAVLGLTGPFSVALAPLFLWRALDRPTRFSRLLAALAVITGGVQAFLIVRGGIPGGTAPIRWETLAAVPGVRVGGSVLTGGRWDAGEGLPAATLLGVATLAAIGWMALRRGEAGRERRVLGLAFAGLLALALFRCRFVLLDVLHGAGSRYFFPLQLITLWLGIATILAVRQRGRWVGAALAMIAVGLNLPRLREPAFADFNWPAAAARIRAGEGGAVRINPNWEFVMPGTRRDDNASKPDPAGGTLVNLSTRARVTSERPAIIGFALRAGVPRRFLFRAVGPSLAQFNVCDPVSRPTLALLRDGVAEPGLVVAAHRDSDPEMARLSDRCRAFALKAGSDDLLGTATLDPGIYSVVVGSRAGEEGEVLVEVYEVPAESGS